MATFEEAKKAHENGKRVRNEEWDKCCYLIRNDENKNEYAVYNPRSKTFSPLYEREINGNKWRIE